MAFIRMAMTTNTWHNCNPHQHFNLNEKSTIGSIHCCGYSYDSLRDWQQRNPSPWMCNSTDRQRIQLRGRCLHSYSFHNKVCGVATRFINVVTRFVVLEQGLRCRDKDCSIVTGFKMWQGLWCWNRAMMSVQGLWRNNVCGIGTWLMKFRECL